MCLSKIEIPNFFCLPVSGQDTSLLVGERAERDHVTSHTLGRHHGSQTTSRCVTSHLLTKIAAVAEWQANRPPESPSPLVSYSTTASHQQGTAQHQRQQIQVEQRRQRRSRDRPRRRRRAAGRCLCQSVPCAPRAAAAIQLCQCPGLRPH